jgi:hypothetical protein
MKTIEQIKNDILASNPSRTYFVNGEAFEQTDAEFNQAISNKAKIEYEILVYENEQKQSELEKANKKASAEAKLVALGLDADDLKALGL